MTQEQTLKAIYNKYRMNHRENRDTGQICCMWSTDDPPDVIEDTEPIYDIEDAFDVEISDDDAMELYDMHLDEALKYIVNLKNNQDNE